MKANQSQRSLLMSSLSFLAAMLLNSLKHRTKKRCDQHTHFGMESAAMRAA
jgi:hypothetical protein